MHLFILLLLFGQDCLLLHCLQSPDVLEHVSVKEETKTQRLWIVQNLQLNIYTGT